MKKWIALFVIGAVVGLASPAWAMTYALDTDHSSVEFKIRHMFSNVKGTFNKFEGTFVYEPNQPETWSVQTVIQADSIDTRVKERDKHLRSKDFFDVEKYPTIAFKSTGVTDVTGNSAKIHGLLNLHGVEKHIDMDLEIHGVGSDAWGNTLAGFTATAKINRKDFGLNWNQVLEAGQLLVGDEVKITIEVEGILQE